MNYCPHCSTGYTDSHTTCPIHGVLLNKIRKGKRTGWLLALLICAVVLPALSQKDEGPILLPKPKQIAKPASPTLLIMCDLACNWKLDGEAKGRIEAGRSTKIKVDLGQHLVVAVTEDGSDQIKQFVKAEEKGQIVVSIELQPVRDARLKAEQDARDKAAQEVQARTEREARDKAEQEAHDKVAREKKERELQEQRDRAAELIKKGMTLYSFPEEGFSTYFPRYPGQGTNNTTTEAGPLETRQYIAGDSDTALSVTVCDYGAQYAGMDPDNLLEGYKNAILTRSNSHLIREKKITLGVYRGVEFETESKAMHFSVRYYFVGTTLYGISVVSPIKKPYADTMSFLDSFQLIDRVRK